MSEFDGTTDLPDDLSCEVRLFPLPNLVLFPYAMQPLHIFEPRYRELLEDALSDNKLIAMALLSPGWQADYEGRPPVEPVVCIGEVASHARLEDGRFNIILRGVCRARIISELPAQRPFRLAGVQVLEDHFPAEGEAERPALMRRLLELFRRLVPKMAPLATEMEQLENDTMQLGILTDIAAFHFALPIALKQELLSECNVDRRAACLIQRLEDLAAEGAASEDSDSNRKFPPDFSEN